jgi:hypothetical protein
VNETRHHAPAAPRHDRRPRKDLPIDVAGAHEALRTGGRAQAWPHERLRALWRGAQRIRARRDQAAESDDRQRGADDGTGAGRRQRAVVEAAGITPPMALERGRLFGEASVPGGHASVLPGGGPVVVDALIRHPRVHRASFSGGPTTGPRMVHAAA